MDKTRESLLILLCAAVFCALFSTGAFAGPPGKAEALIEKGKAELDGGNYEEAIDAFKEARGINPSDSVAAFLLGIAYVKAQDYREAKGHLKAAVELKPGVKEAVIELADVLYNIEENEEALKYLDIADRENVAPARSAFLRGLVLMKLKKNDEAIGSLKRAGAMDAKYAQAADYQIALANLMEGRLKEAGELFKDISRKDPTAEVSEFAREYATVISKRLKEERPLKLSAGAQFQHDDNVLLKPNDSAAAANITGESDNLSLLSFRADYDFGLKGPLGLRAQYSLSQSLHFKLKTHDVQSHAFSVTPGYALGKGLASLYAEYAFDLVHNDRYLQALTLSPSYTYPLDAFNTLQASLKYRKNDYLKYTAGIGPDEDRDGTDAGFGISWFRLFAGDRGLFNARYDFDRDQTQGRNWRSYGNKLGLSVSYRPADPLSLSVSAESYTQSYTETHSSFNVKRKDTTYTYSAVASYTVYDDVDLQAEYVHVREDSNIAVYDYGKNVISLGAAMRF